MKQEKDRSKLKTKKWGHVVQIGNKKKKTKIESSSSSEENDSNMEDFSDNNEE